MRTLRFVFVFIPFSFLASCATYSGYQPVVDTRVDRNPQFIQADTEECRALARQSSSTTENTLKGGAVGALGGAAAGAALGAILGDPGTGAAIGAAAGGIGGAGYSGVDADSQFRRAFVNCMRNRGHSVID